VLALERRTYELAAAMAAKRAAQQVAMTAAATAARSPCHGDRDTVETKTNAPQHIRDQEWCARAHLLWGVARLVVGLCSVLSLNTTMLVTCGVGAQ
jgi:hypothetical protein